MSEKSKILLKFKRNIQQKSWVDTPIFLISVHIILIFFGFLICNRLYQYHIEILRYKTTVQELNLNKNILEELKTKNSYLSSNSYILKTAKQIYDKRKSDGEKVLDISKLQGKDTFKEGDYLPIDIKQKQSKFEVLWRQCFESKEADACNVK